MFWSYEYHFSFFNLVLNFFKRHKLFIKGCLIIGFFAIAQVSQIAAAFWLPFICIFMFIIPFYDYCKNGERLCFKVFAGLFCFFFAIVSLVSIESGILMLLDVLAD